MLACKGKKYNQGFSTSMVMLLYFHFGYMLNNTIYILPAKHSFNISNQTMIPERKNYYEDVLKALRIM